MGRFIVIYGSNNLGKSTQLDLLEKEYQSIGLVYHRIKYPIYDSPTGRIINAVLREGMQMSEYELQSLYAENRREYELELMQLLSEGDVIAEDYTGTGKAWGLTKGVDKEFLDYINADLLKPDIEILLDGERFGCGIEKKHRHEGAGQEIWEKSRRVHLELAAELGWSVVNANESVEDVHTKIMDLMI